MLNQTQNSTNVDFDDLPAQARSIRSDISPFDVLSAARRQIWIILISIAVVLTIAIYYVIQAIPTYSSSVSILIDAKNVGMTAASPLEGSLTFETGAIDSQLEILGSDKLARSVARRLGLQNNMDFLDPPASQLGRVIRSGMKKIDRVIALFTDRPPDPAMSELPEDVRLDFAVEKLLLHMNVTRVGRTYVFNLRYTDRDPQLAQSIAGQYANAYLEDQLDSKFDATKRATNWMEERIRELKTRSLAADDAVQKYRAENNLIEASGRLLNEQSLTDATTQMTQARAMLDVASARYQRLKQIVDSQDLNAGLTQSSDNPNVAQLRSRYLQASKLESEISLKFGKNHEAAKKARRDMEQYTRLIFEELQNLLPGYQSDVAIAQAQVNSVQNTIDQLQLASASNDNAMVKLRALIQEADSYKTLYSTFLQKAQEMQQQQSFPVTDARVISDASATSTPAGPKKGLILVVAVMLGAAIGAGVGFIREWRDRGFRTAAQVRDELKLEFIANIPALKRQPQIKAGGGVSVDGRRLILRNDPLLQMVTDQPFSQFSESIRTMKLKLNSEFPKGKGVVVGMVSLYPNEGKSTIAKNLASSLAIEDRRTLLIDGDLRNPSLTDSLVGLTKAGLVDVIHGRHDLDEALSYEQATGLAFLPGAVRAQSANDLFGNEKTHHLINSLRQRYDVIVIDFPPVGALTDAMSASSAIDGYFFVTHWGTTPRKAMKEFILNHADIADKTIGVVLNRVDLKLLGRYSAYPTASQYGKYAGRYFS
jgi:polysaccharide biosynthesis transport protein